MPYHRGGGRIVYHKIRLNLQSTIYKLPSIKERRFALCKSLVLSKNGKEKRPAFGLGMFLNCVINTAFLHLDKA